VKGGQVQSWLKPGAALAVAALMIALYGADKSLANLETREVNAEARDLFASGEKLLETGKAAAAVDDFQRAHSLDRTNRTFELALAGAHLTAGNAGDAELMLAEALNRNSNDGRANLLMARVRVAQGRFDDAVSYYHRAIYGAWPDGSAADVTNARLELANHLAKRGRQQELLSELLLLDDAGQKDPQLARKVAALYLDAGSASRAEAAYRSMVRADPGDSEAYEGLGQAELRLGEYRAAHGAFATALRDRPDDPKAAARVQLADRLAELDPTSRRLGSAEKFRRSQEILSLTEDATMGCLKGQAAPQPLSDLLAVAGKLRSEKTSITPSNEAAEARLELAGQLWKARLQTCNSELSEDDPLAIIIRKIEQ
jgi:tetratricopeptide (TPR) repeat protein